jgi:serine/threonine-protein kinase
MSADVERLNDALGDRYTLERELGQGGMATVYLAQDRKHDRQVAIKVLRPELAVTLGPDRFLQEIQIAAQLSHPHILPLFDSGSADGLLYYVMPYVEGESLRERIDREETLSVAEAVRLTDEIASALNYAHKQGIVHRDVKPENIMLSGGRAVVADFGIGRAVTAAGGDRLTGTGFAVGTPAYMSPEQAFGEADIDGRSDVYALGCVLYEMVSGHTPFEAETPQALLAKQAAGTTPSLRRSDPAVPLFVERAVERALAKRPDDRFQSASEFAEALTSEMVVARVGRRRWPKGVIAAATVGVALIAAWVQSAVWGGAAYERLAVLPPTNLMNDAGQDHIVQGMLGGLIAELGQAGITVIGSLQSMMRYRDTELTVREIAAEMGVDAVLESSVLWLGDSVAIDVRLTDGRTEESLWSQSYDERAQNVLVLYRQVTSAVADEIQVALTPQAEARLASAQTVDPQAMESYLEGQRARTEFWATESAGLRAFALFEDAVEKDSTFAEAWAARAMVGFDLAWAHFLPPDEIWPEIREAVLVAVTLDPDLPEGHLALGLLKMYRDWDWDGAEREFQAAIRGNPSNPDFHSSYATLLACLERYPESTEHAQMASDLDPSNLSRLLDVAFHHHFARNEQEVEDRLAVLFDSIPDHPGPYYIASNFEVRRGNLSAAVPYIEKNIELLGDGSTVKERMMLGHVLGRLGRTEEARAQLAEVDAQEAAGIYVSPFERAFVYVGLGETEQALDLLEEAALIRDPWMPVWQIFGGDYLQPVWDEPRVQAILERMDFPEVGAGA